MTDEVVEKPVAADEPTPRAEPVTSSVLGRAQKLILVFGFAAFVATAVRAPYLSYEVVQSAQGERRSARLTYGTLWNAPPAPARRAVPGEERRETDPELDSRRMVLWWVDILLVVGIGVSLTQAKVDHEIEDPPSD